MCCTIGYATYKVSDCEENCDLTVAGSSRFEKVLVCSGSCCVFKTRAICNVMYVGLYNKTNNICNFNHWQTLYIYHHFPISSIFNYFLFNVSNGTRLTLMVYCNTVSRLLIVSFVAVITRYPEGRKKNNNSS